ncbi:hypothetical protein [Cupriavidus basilensis]|uniref:hypothetical protein n=1 Tax=Cupriavidus basilensis TaxID=68895 RepID=UPI0011858FC6|nr:hypothetical protein [Cupriavidus basilensis]
MGNLAKEGGKPWVSASGTVVHVLRRLVWVSLADYAGIGPARPARATLQSANRAAVPGARRVEKWKTSNARFRN